MNQLVALQSVVIFISLFSFCAQGQQPTPEEQTLRLRADLVVIDLLPVHKKTGRVLPDLAKDDVVLFEDGVKQTVTHFSRGKEPVSILLLVDRAGCVNAFNEQIRAATVEAVSRLKPEDEVAIMTFSNKVSLQQPFTRDRALIADKIMSVESQHQSEQHYFNAGIYEAAEYMRKAANPAGRRLIVVLTSLEASIDFSKRSEGEALEAVLESGAVVSGVLVKTLGGRFEQTFRGKPTSLLRRLGLRSGSLKKFVEETGGELLSEPPKSMSRALNRVVDNVAASYSLAYTPTNTARDGKRRRIRIQVADGVEKREGKVVMLSRRSYIMPKAAEATEPATK
ncbi:MAG TPA: VWA domain-containing protein [Blastocatellia bacterium]|nr:VWA domain-containing protein [Blastocatellia bacterium]